MTYEVVISKQADSDLRGIYEYIAFELLSMDNAIGQLDRLERNIICLETFPEKYRAYDKEPWHSRGMRIMPIDNFLVFYIPNEETAVVTIIRVIYSGRDIDNELSVRTQLQFSASIVTI